MTESNFEPVLALVDAVQIFERYSIPYFLVGSFASGFRGEFRATNDLDIVCDFTRFSGDDLEEILYDFKKSFFCDEVSGLKTIKSRKCFNVIHEKTFVKVDLFSEISELEKEQFSLSTELKVPTLNKKIHVATAEYNIIAKLNWYIKSNRVLDRQKSDVRNMLKVNKDNLDYDYLYMWSDKFKTRELLEELIAQS